MLPGDPVHTGRPAPPAEVDAFDLFFDVSPMPGLLWQPVRDAAGTITDLRIVRLNAAAAGKAITPGADLVGASGTAVFGQEAIAPYLDAATEVLGTTRGRVFDTWFAPTARWYKVTALPAGALYATLALDITEEREAITRAEAATAAAERARADLAESEARYRLVAESAADVVFQGSNDGITTWVSESIERLTGWTPDQLIGQPFGAFIDPRDRPALRDVQARVLAGEEQRFEARFATADGAFRRIAVLVRPVFGANGTVVGRVGGWRDVEMEHATREALQEAHDLAQLGTWRRDLRTGTTTWSKRMFDIFGLDPDGPSPTADQVDALLTPAGRAARVRAVEESGGGSFETEVEVHRPDGDVRWVLQRGRPEMDGDGRVVAVHGTALDVTERKRAELALAGSEARYRLLATNATDIVAHMTPDGAVDWVSPSVEAVLGWRPEDLLGAGMGTLLHPDDVEAVKAAGPPPVRVRGRLRTASGSWRWMESLIRPQLDDDGRVTGLVSGLRDVGAEVAAEEALRLRGEALEEAQRIAHVGSWTWDRATDTVTWSSEMFRLLGFEPADEPPPAHERHARYEDESRVRLMEAFGRCTDDGTPYEVRVVTRWPDGSRHHAIAHGEAFTGDDGVQRLRGTLTDIGELVAAQAAIAASEARYRFIAENVSDMISQNDLEGRLEYVSEASRIVLGYEPAELVGRNYAEFVAPEGQAAARAGADLVIAGAMAVQRMRLRHKDGTSVWVEFSVRPIVDEAGRVTGSTAVGRNVQAQVEAEERLAERTAQLAHAQRIARMAAFHVDLETGRVTLSDEALELGRRGPEHRQITLADVVRYVSPESAALARLHIERAVATGETPPFEQEVLLGDGTRGWFEVAGQPLRDATGRVVGFDATILDVTERRAAAAQLAEANVRLEEAQRIAHVGSWSWSAETRRTTWSDEMFRIVGRPVGNPEVEPADVEVLLSAQAIEDRRTVFTEVLHSGAAFEREVTITRADGSVRQLVVRGEATRNSDGVVNGMRGSVADVTELRAAQEHIASAQRAELVGQLAGGIAHDYNNILATIVGHAELLRADLPAGTELRADAIAVLEAAGRAAMLTRRLLAYGRRQPLHPAALDANAVVGELLPLIRSTCGDRVAVSFRAGYQVPEIRADRGVVEQALLNLTLNARDAMPDGGTLLLSVDTADVPEGDPRLGEHVLPGRFVRICVTDTGTGVAAADLPHIFEPFYSTKDPSLGAGLGLASVAGSIGQSCGMVTVETKVGGGSTFALLLPVAPGAAGARPSTAVPAPAPAKQTEGLHVLAVEDERAVRMIVTRMLEVDGHSVTPAADAAEALGAVAAGLEPDLLLADIQMPGMRGTELARRLQEANPALRVVLMSAYSPEQVLENGDVPPGTVFLAKPFTREALRSAIAESAC